MRLSRPANSKVRHGMATCRRYGCDRSECRNAESRRKKLSDIERSRGITSRIPADEAAAHARRLVACGVPPKEISERSGVSVSSVRNLIAGRMERMERANAEAILGLPIPKGDYEATEEMLCDATASRRRLQALGVCGFPRLILAREIGISSHVVGDIRDGRQDRVLLSTHRAIESVYDRWWNADPKQFGARECEVTLTKKRAAREHWAPPAAWDEETIGDPTAKPVVSTGEPQYVALVEDAQWLVSEYGYTHKEAAERLGVTPQQLGAAFSNYTQAMKKAEAS